MKSIFATIFIEVLIVTAVAGCGRLGFQQTSNLTDLVQSAFVETPETVTVQVKNYCPTSGRSFKDVFVSNFSVEVIQGQNRFDSDADGLPDFIETENGQKFNISPYSTDSNNDGFGDLFMYLSGIDASQQSHLRCLDASNGDGSGVVLARPGQPDQFIGLTNCEKELMHIDPADFDTDGDGIPDILELRCGLNPADSNDALLDPDGDGLTNYEECKRHTPSSESNKAGGLSKLEYVYKQTVRVANGQQCIDFEISNISVLNHGKDNLIALYLTEVDGYQKEHLSTTFMLLPNDSAGSTIAIEYARFTAK